MTGSVKNEDPMTRVLAHDFLVGEAFPMICGPCFQPGLGTDGAISAHFARTCISPSARENFFF